MLRDFMHAAASIPVGAVISLLIVSIFTVMAINAIFQAARTQDDDVVSLRQYRREREAMRDATR